MQSVLVLPLVMPPPIEAAVDHVAPSDGAFQLSFAADALQAEKLSTPREGGDPTPLAVIPVLPFPLALTLPMVPEDATAGMTIAPSLDPTIATETIDLAPEDMADPGVDQATVLDPSDMVLAAVIAPVLTPLVAQLPDSGPADAPLVNGGRFKPDVAALPQVQMPAHDQTGVLTVLPMPGLTVPEGQDKPVGPEPEVRIADPEVWTPPLLASAEPPLTAPVPADAPRQENAGPPPEAGTSDREMAYVPGRPTVPADPTSIVSGPSVAPEVADRPERFPDVPPADLTADLPADRPAGLPAGATRATAPLHAPLQEAVAADPIAFASIPAGPAATEPVVVPTTIELIPTPDPAVSAALQNVARPDAEDGVTAPQAPVHSAPTPTPGFWERLYSGLVAAPSDKVTVDPGSEDFAPSEVTASPRDAKTLPLTMPPPSEPAAVALFARDQTRSQGQEVDIVLDAMPAGSLPFASASGPMAAASTTPFAPQTGPTALPVPQVAGQIAAALSQTSDGATELALSPEELGHVRLKLERDAKHPERMIVHITFERPETLDLFRRHAGELAEALRDAGFAGADIGFGQQGGGSNEFTRGEDRRTFAGTAAVGPGESPRPEPSSPRPTAGASLDLRL